MTVASRKVWTYVAGLAIAAALPIAAGALRGDRGERCDLDGVTIEPTWRVRFVDDGGRERRFCCVDCARRWIDRSHDVPDRIAVTDEATGAEIDAEDAWFVRSSVVSFATSGSHLHVFAREADARRHAEAFRGAVLAGKERPFDGRE